MQFDRQSATTAASNEAYWRQLDTEVSRLRRRSRRQFLTAAGGLAGGTALLLGGMAWASNPNMFQLPKTSACTPGSTSAQGGPVAQADLLESVAGEQMTLKVAQISKSVNFFPFYVAQQKGYFTSKGLTIVGPDILQVGSTVVAKLNDGTYDIGNGVITDAFVWSTTNSSARIIAAMMNGYAIDVVLSKKLQNSTGLTASSPLLDKINALKGKKVGITGKGSGTQALLIYLFRQHGMDASKDITQVALGSTFATALQALKNGTVDALSFAVPTGEEAEAQGLGEILISPVRGDIPKLVGYLLGVTYVKQSVIDAKPQAIAAYIQALNLADVYMLNNPTETKALLKTYLGQNDAVTNAVYANNASVFPRSPVISPTAYSVAGQFHLDAGLISGVAPYNSLVATNTINSALGLSTNPCPS